MTLDEIIGALVELGPADAPGFDEPLVHQHQAVLYHSMREFLAGTVPHLREGIAAGAPTIAVAPLREADALREVLGQDAPAVQFIDPLDVYANPVRAMAAISAVARTLGPRPAWVVATDDWERYPDPIEWVRYESLLNVSFPNQRFHARCCYDTRVVSAEVVDYVRRTHPEVFEERPSKTVPSTAIRWTSSRTSTGDPCPPHRGRRCRCGCSPRTCTPSARSWPSRRAAAA